MKNLKELSHTGLVEYAKEELESYYNELASDLSGECFEMIEANHQKIALAISQELKSRTSKLEGYKSLIQKIINYPYEVEGHPKHKENYLIWIDSLLKKLPKLLGHYDLVYHEYEYNPYYNNPHRFIFKFNPKDVDNLLPKVMGEIAEELFSETLIYDSNEEQVWDHKDGTYGIIVILSSPDDDIFKQFIN